MSKDNKDHRSSQISSKKGYKRSSSDSNPATSERKKRQFNRKSYGDEKTQVLYNEMGVLIKTGQDLCDCLESRCQGCHFPCPKCKSTKCGHECRCNRDWAYTSIAAPDNNNCVTVNPNVEE